MIEFVSTTISVDSSNQVLVDSIGDVFATQQTITIPDSTNNDSICYVFYFVDQAAAQRDFIISALRTSEVLVFKDLTVNSVTPYSGFWCMIVQTGINSLLFDHKHLMLAFDLNLMARQQDSVIVSAIPTAHVGIVVNAYSNFLANGLFGTGGIPPATGQLALEDGNLLLLEDGRTPLELEA